MNVRVSRLFPALAAFLAIGAVASWANAIPVSVDLTSLHVIQPFSGEKDQPEDAYLLVTGVAKGKALEMTKAGPWNTGRKKPVDISAKKPAALWTGDLADGEFAELTVTLFQGKGNDAKIKEFTGKLAEADKKVAALNEPKIANAEAQTKLATDLLAAHRDVIVNIKKMFNREAKTDHYGGQFSLVVSNIGGKIIFRLDPVGLTFGEHYGKKEKIYTKLKRTKQNVLVPDETGELSEKWLDPVDDEETTIRIKMLETENLGIDPKTKNTTKDTIYKVTDYLAELQVKANGKPMEWRLGGEKTGVDEIHTYFEFAFSKPEKVKK